MINWYAIHSKPKPHEWMRANLNLRNQGLEVLAPLELAHRPKRERLNDRGECIGVTPSRVFYRPLFPRYLFAAVSESYLPRVCHTLGVQEVIGQRLIGAGIPVDQEFIEELRGRMNRRGVVGLDDERQAPRLSLVPGQPVTVTRGSFSGLSGVFDRALSGDQRVVILLNSLFGNADYRSLELPAGYVSAVGV